MQWFSIFKEFLIWLDARGVVRLCDVTQELLEEYRLDVGEQDTTLESKIRRLTEVRRLWTFRSVLPEDMRLPQLPPWSGADTHELFGRFRTHRENLTPRIHEDTMGPLLVWALRFVEDSSTEPLSASRFRRTLAWLIRRRPRGLVAGAIQYGHVHTPLDPGLRQPSGIASNGRKGAGRLLNSWSRQASEVAYLVCLSREFARWIRPKQDRSTALFTLASELPAAILARALGVHIKVAVQWQQASAGDWAAYAADVSLQNQH